MFGIISDILGGVARMQHAEEMQDDAQNFAADQASQSRSFNSAEAAKTREFQKEMRATQYQTSVQDLRNAGLNPMLAYMHGGSGTPQGATATSSPASAGTATPSSGHSIAAGMQSAAQVDLIRAEEAKVLAEAKRIEAEEKEILERTRNYDPQRREIEARIPTHAASVSKMQQDIAESAVRIERIWEEAAHLKSSAKHLDQQVINLKETIPLIRTQIQQLRALTAKDAATTDEIKQRIAANLPSLEATLRNIEAQDRRMAQPGHAAQAAAHDSLVGQIGAYLRAINPLNAFLRSAK